MTVIRHASPHSFLDRVGPLLDRAEAENNLLLGLTEMALCDPVVPPPSRWFLSIENEGQVVGAALIGEPIWNIILTPLPPQVVPELVTWLVQEAVPVQGVIGPNSTSALVAEYWSRTQQTPLILKFNQRIYQCTAVEPLPAVPGSFREARVEELDFLIQWGREFDREVNHNSPPGQADDVMRRAIERRALFLWDHDGPVACAATSRETSQGISVMQVYTPPIHRGRGYASAVVSALTRLQLDRGKRFCALYTDLANPISNRIYQRIGYVPVCDSQLWKFNSK